MSSIIRVNNTLFDLTDTVTAVSADDKIRKTFAYVEGDNTTNMIMSNIFYNNCAGTTEDIDGNLSSLIATDLQYGLIDPSNKTYIAQTTSGTKVTTSSYSNTLQLKDNSYRITFNYAVPQSAIKQGNYYSFINSLSKKISITNDSDYYSKISETISSQVGVSQKIIKRHFELSERFTVTNNFPFDIYISAIALSLSSITVKCTTTSVSTSSGDGTVTEKTDTTTCTSGSDGTPILDVCCTPYTLSSDGTSKDYAPVLIASGETATVYASGKISNIYSSSSGLVTLGTTVSRSYDSPTFVIDQEWALAMDSKFKESKYNISFQTDHYDLRVNDGSVTTELNLSKLIDDSNLSSDYTWKIGNLF